MERPRFFLIQSVSFLSEKSLYLFSLSVKEGDTNKKKKMYVRDAAKTKRKKIDIVAHLYHYQVIMQYNTCGDRNRIFSTKAISQL